MTDATGASPASDACGMRVANGGDERPAEPSASAPVYVCGHSPFELDRLARQDRLYGAISRQMLQEAGLREGMHVLDLGCGTGGLSLLAAAFVGETGRVVGVDRSEAALALARARATGAGRANLDFVTAEIDNLGLDRAFDAVIGRFVLMHQRSASVTLRSALRCLHEPDRPCAAFLESDLAATLALAERRGSAACAEVLRLKIRIIEAGGARADLGLRLSTVFREAGFPPPWLRLHGPVATAAQSDLVGYMVDSLRSLNASASRLGVTAASESEITQLGDLMEQDSAKGVPVFAPLVVSAVL